MGLKPLIANQFYYGGGASTPPAGSDTQVQYNNAGVFGADAGFTYNKAGGLFLGQDGAQAGQLSIYGSGAAGGSILLHNTGGFHAEILNSNLTDDRTFQFPDVSGTLAVEGAVASLGANTFTALQTITQASANSGILASTGYSLTGSNATSMVSLAGTLNTTGAPKVIDVAITNTASDASSKFFSFSGGAAGATELAYLRIDGSLRLLKSYSASNVHIGDATGGISFSAGDTFFANGGNSKVGITTADGLIVNGSLGIGFTSGNADAAGNDAVFMRDAADIIAMKRASNAQTFRVYGNTTGSHYLNLTHNGTNAVLSVNGGGDLHISSLPTANPGPGILWNNAGTPAIGT